MYDADPDPFRLLARRADLEVLRQEWTVIEDVLAGAGAVRCARHLPKNAAEHELEYQRRLGMTPVFAETPQLLQLRQGALFRSPPQVQLPDELSHLFTQAAPAGATLYDLIAKVSEVCQTQGFAGVLLDREPLPAELAEREAGTLSVAEAEARGLNRIQLAVYPAEQILDWACDAKGLAWVKLLETQRRAEDWAREAETVQVVRVADREAVTVYEARRGADGRPEARRSGRAVHEARDGRGAPVVPFRFFHPFPARDGLGRPILKGAAEADLAATRVLSELLWFLHMLCPLLCLRTHRPPEELGDIGLGASRFLILQAKNAGREAEELFFATLDPTAVDRLAACHERLTAKAREQASLGAAGVAGPVEQSGISKAWTFKTGEERVLFLLGRELQAGFQWLLEQAERMASSRAQRGAAETPRSTVAVRFPESYDVAGPEERLRALDQALGLFQRYGLRSAVASLLEQAAETALGGHSEETWAAVARELAELRERRGGEG